MGYLVISVKLGQKIQIGEGISLIITDFFQGKIDVAIDAPRDLKIKRLQTLQEKENSNGNKNRNSNQPR